MKTNTLSFGCLVIITLLCAMAGRAQTLEIEDNNSLASAMPLVFDRSGFSAVVVGSATAGDVDYYSFVAPIPALFGTVKVWALVDTGGGPPVSGGNRNSFLTLLDESGIEEATDDNDGTGNGRDGSIETFAASVITGHALTLPGTMYYLAVTHPMAGGVLDQYTLYVAVTFEGEFGAPLPGEVEPNDTGFDALDSSNWILSTNTSATEVRYGVIPPLVPPFPLDVDLYALMITAPSLVHIHADGDPERDGVNTDVTLQLYEIDGVTPLMIPAVNSSVPATVSPANPVLGEGFCFDLAPGIYFVGVTATAAAPGSYGLVVGMENPGTIGFGTGISRVREDAGAVTVTLTRSGGSYGSISLDYTTADGTATASDYVPVSGTVTFEHRETIKTITIPITDDRLTESNEMFRVTLGGVPDWMAVAILDDDEMDNDSPGTAIALDVSTGMATTYGRISPAGDVDYFAFEAPAGARVSAVVDTGAQEPWSSTWRGRLSLFAAGGIMPLEVETQDGTSTALGTGYPHVGFSSAIAGRTLPEAGTYYLRVEADDAGGIIDPYQVFLVVDSTMPRAEVQSGTTIDHESWPIAAYNGRLGAALETDVYHLYTQAGSLFQISVDCDPERDGVNTDLIIELRSAATGWTLLRADSSTPTNSINRHVARAFCWRNSSSQDQTYVISVYGRGTGTYRLTAAAQATGVLQFSSHWGSANPVSGGTRHYLCEAPYYIKEGGWAVVRVNRSYGNQGEVTADFITADATATAGLDYTPTNGTLHFAHGETGKTIVVRTAADGLAEHAEEVNIRIGNFTGGATSNLNSACNSWILPIESKILASLFIFDNESPRNDNFLTAQPLQLAGGSVTEVTSTLSYNANVNDGMDVYQIATLHPARLWMLVDTDTAIPHHAFSRDSLLTLYAGDQSVVESDDDDGFGTASAIAGRILTAGNYYVKVQLATPWYGCEPFVESLDALTYRLLIVQTDGGTIPEQESNNSTNSPNPLVTLNSPMAIIAGTFANASDVDVYAVEASRGDEILVSVDENPERDASRTDATISLIAPIPGSSEVSMANSPACDAAPAESFIFTAQASGRYYLALRPTPFQPLGNYHLMVLRRSPPGPTLSNISIGPAQVASGSGAWLSGTISGAHAQDPLLLRVDWGDGSGIQTIYLAPGANGFNVSHTYADARPDYRIEILLNNEQSGGSTSLATNVSVCLGPLPGVISWWPGDGRATDLIGNKHGTLIGDASYVGDGHGTAFNLDGAGDFVRMGDVLDMGARSFSVEAWFKLTSVPSNYRIVSKGFTRNSGPEWTGYTIHGYGGWLGFVAHDGAPTGSSFDNAKQVEAATPTPSVGQWHHVVGVLDRGAARIRLYLDGAFIAEDGLQYFLPGFPPRVRSLGGVDNEISFAIGAQDTYGGGGGREPVHFFPGQINEVAVYNRVLSGPEIRTLYLAGSLSRCKPLPSNMQLQLAAGAGQLTIGWPISPFPVVLESSADLRSPNWEVATETPDVVGLEKRLTINPTGPARFYRLRSVAP